MPQSSAMSVTVILSSGRSSSSFLREASRARLVTWLMAHLWSSGTKARMGATAL